MLTFEAGDTTETLYSENYEESELSKNAIPAVRQKNHTPGVEEQGIVNICGVSELNVINSLISQYSITCFTLKTIKQHLIRNRLL